MADLDPATAVLSSLLVNPKQLDEVAFLTPDDFAFQEQRVVFRAMRTIADNGGQPDLVTLYTQIGTSLDDTKSGIGYLTELATAGVSSLNAVHYAKLVKDRATKARLVRAGGTIANLGQDESVTPEEGVRKAFALLEGLEEQRISSDFAHAGELVEELRTSLEAGWGSPDGLTGLDTGFLDLNRLTGGLQRGDLVILAARPSMGKTALALNVLYSQAIGRGIPVGMFSVEMSAQQLLMRLICLDTQIPFDRLRSGRLRTDEKARVEVSLGRIQGAPIFLDDTADLEVHTARARARRLCSRQGVGLIIVDYLQLMNGGGGENRVQEVRVISGGLKAMGRENDVPVLALSQLSRAPEQRPNHEPLLSDLRESGSLEQDADLVMFIYRDKIYNPDTDRPHVAQVIVAKQRNGPLGIVDLFFQEDAMRFLDIAHTEPF